MSSRSIVTINSAFAYKIAESEEEKSKIYDLRESIWKDEFPYLLNHTGQGHPAKDAYDDRSWVYYCSDVGNVIGSCRASPMLEGQWEISSSLPPNVYLQYDPQTTLQIEKVYIRAGYRNSCLHEFIFYYFSDWLLNHTAYTRYFAVCNAELVRLYRRLGARQAIQEGLLLNGRAAHKYYIVEGKIADVRAVIKQAYSL